MREQELQEQIILLASHTTDIFFTQEYTLRNIKPDLKKDINIIPFRNPKEANVKTRRLDLVQEFDSYVRILELKMKTITVEDVSNIIGTRKYARLARTHFNKEVYLYILNQKRFGIEEEALSLINEIPNCFYMTVEELCKAIFEEYVKSLPNEGKWKAKDLYKKKFASIIGEYNLSCLGN